MTDPAARSNTLVRVQDLRKHYGPIRAVDGITFEVHRGDVLGFLGPNGAGKTTAMKLITGFLEPDAGSIEVAGLDVAVASARGASPTRLPAGERARLRRDDRRRLPALHRRGARRRFARPPRSIASSMPPVCAACATRP